jgi:hypothetical protein
MPQLFAPSTSPLAVSIAAPHLFFFFALEKGVVFLDGSN